jgi:hypothetical protein
MPYLVTHGNGPTAIDTKPDLDTALAYARELLAAGMPNVAISDGAGKNISGDELVECCNGEKSLTADLRAS